jgi:hypothetical protein
VKNLIKNRVDQVQNEGGTPETVTVPWREGTKNLPVISVPVALLYYNPDSRRLRAQRTLDPAEDRAAQEDPWSDRAQAYFDRLLRGKPSEPQTEDPEFLRLREDLEIRGQTEPGIVTDAGVLVNANTRRAALRDIGTQEMRVAVLPSDASLEDCEAIELALQLRKEHKRPYSFINRLLALRREQDRGIPPATIARNFGIAVKSLTRDMWILNLIEEAVARSHVVAEDGTETALRLIDFEDDQGKLEEFYRAWAAIPEGKKDEREALRETRLAAIALGLPKTSVRGIRESFAEQELTKWLPPAEEGNSSSGIPGLGDDIVIDDESVMTRRIKGLTDDVLKRRGRQVSTKESDSHLAALRSEFETGIRKVLDTDLLRQRQLAPAEELSDAVEHVRQCTALLVNARVAGGAQLDDLDEQAANLREELAQLARQLGPQPDAGEGLAWLMQATE